MKTNTNRSLGNKAIALMLVLTMVFSLMVSSVAYAATNKNDENLITNVSNPSSGTISFYLNVPAGATASYKVELIPNARTGSLDTKSGSVKNSGTTTLSKKISVQTKYYSNKYTVTASYSTGPARNRTNYSDTDNAVSALKSTTYSTKFVWDDANIKKWQAGKAIAVTLTFAATVTVDILVTKGKLTTGVATALGISLFVKDLATSGEYTETKNITSTPIKGWGYQYKLVPTSSGFSRYLVVYDEYNRVYETLSLGSISLGTIFPVVK